MSTASHQLPPARVAVVLKHVESLRFGTDQIAVHEARVVQVEKTEKLRLDRGDESPVPLKPRYHWTE